MAAFANLIIRPDFRLSAQNVLEIGINNGQSAAEFRQAVYGPDNAMFIDDVATGTSCEKDFEEPTRAHYLYL